MSHSMLTEEEFKKVLKSLFVEKKRVKELQKQIEEQGLQKKFHTKISDIHKLSLAEEYAKLKSAYLEKEKECETHKEQIYKVKPAFKKLLGDLKEAKESAEKKEKVNHISYETLKKAVQEKDRLLDGAKEKIVLLEKDKKQLQLNLEKREEEALHFNEKICQLNEKLKEENSKRVLLEEMLLQEKKVLKATQEELKKVQINEKNALKDFEEQKSKLVQKLADSLKPNRSSK